MRSVTPASAIASDARNVSPSPTPSTSGEPARAHHAVRLVAAEHGDGVGALQARHGALHGVEQVALVQVRHQVRDHLGVGLAGEHVALGLQLGAQLLVVLDDAVVHQRDAPRRVAGSHVRAGAKCGCALCTAGAPCVAQRVCAMPVPASMRSASTFACSSATREVLRARRRPPPWCTATPQES
jgi:hypothetical protein